MLLALFAVLECACAHATDKTHLTFCVKLNQTRITTLHRHFDAVSDPSSLQYGQFFTRDQVAELMTPNAGDVDQLAEHLTGLNIPFSTSFAKDKFFVEYDKRAIDGFAEDQLLPPSIRDIVETVIGLQTKTYKTSSGPDSPRPHSPADAANCLAERVDPPCLRQSYGLDAYVARDNTTIGQAVIVNNYYKDTDLAAFELKYKLPPVKVKTVGDKLNQANTEATLDVQYITAVGQKVPTTWVYIDGSSPTNPYEKWLTWAAAAPDASIPKVHSLSVGIKETEFEAVIPRMNLELMALGTRGVSIVFATGDSGYRPALNYGGSSPFVTAVGGVWNGNLGTLPLEVDPITTGGFSALDDNPIQSWQVKAVQTWQNTSGRRPLVYNASRRCVPDLSAYDSGVYITQDGAETPAGGTSAAAPIVAGMLGSINAALADRGHSPLGFANPFLYANEDAFEDVIRGGNGIGGYSATEGYDPASGLGTFSVTTYKTLLARAILAKEQAATRRAALAKP